jgi:hypothetical protein
MSHEFALGQLSGEEALVGTTKRKICPNVIRWGWGRGSQSTAADVERGIAGQDVEAPAASGTLPASFPQVSSATYIP